MKSGSTTTEAPNAAIGSDECARCCPRYHEAVELVGKRWTGAILYVLLHGGRMRFTEIAHSVPDLSDRLLSERMKELEARGIVERHVSDGTPTKVSYELTPKGPRARARDGGAQDVGGPLVGLSPTARTPRPAPRSTSLHASMSDRPQNAEDVKALVAENSIRFIRLWFTDILGQLKSFSISAEQLDDAFEGGMGFDGSSITGFNAIEESDMIAMPDAVHVQRAALAAGGRGRSRAHVRRRQDAGGPPLRG